MCTDIPDDGPTPDQEMSWAIANDHADDAEPDPEPDITLPAELHQVIVWTQHTKSGGAWCAWSGCLAPHRLATEEDQRCPHQCPGSKVEPGRTDCGECDRTVDQVTNTGLCASCADPTHPDPINDLADLLHENWPGVFSDGFQRRVAAALIHELLPGDVGILLTRDQLQCWAGDRMLSPDHLERLSDAIPNSAIPEAIGLIVDGMDGEV